MRITFGHNLEAKGHLLPGYALGGGGGSSGGGYTDYSVSVNPAAVPSNQSNFVVPVDLSNAPAGFWSVVQDDGANIRATDSGGAGVPFDLVSINKSAKTGWAYVKLASVSASAATDFNLRVLSDPSDFDEANRNAVWSDYYMVHTGGVDNRNRVTGVPLRVDGDPHYFQNQGTLHTFTDDPHQGVAHDPASGDWYTVDNNKLVRYNSGWVSQATNNDPSGDAEASAGIGTLGHCCAPVVAGGYLVVPINNYPTETKAVLALFDLTTLAFVAAQDISAIDPKISGVGWTGDRLVTVNWGALSLIRQWTLTGTTIAHDTDIPVSLTGGPLTKAQGIAYWQKAFWITDDERDEIIRVELDGSGDRSSGLANLPISGSLEGLTPYDGGLAILADPTASNSYVAHFKPTEIGLGGGGVHWTGTSRVVFDLPATGDLGTVWTMGASFDPSDNTQRGIMAAAQTGTGNTNNAAIVVDNGNNLGGWDGQGNGWFYCSPTVDPPNGAVNRVHMTYDGTTARTVRYNAASIGTDTGISAVGSGVSHIVIGSSRESGSTEVWRGDIGFCYVRKSVLSDDWITAEYNLLSNNAANVVFGGITSNWLLSTGAWNDTGVWEDTANWKDA